MQTSRRAHLLDKARDPSSVRQLYLLGPNETLPQGTEDLAARTGWRGEVGQVLVTPDGALVGKGDGTDLFALGAASAKLSGGPYNLADALPPGDQETMLLGWCLGGYRYDRYRDVPPGPALLCPNGIDGAAIEQSADILCFVRDLVNTPAEEMDPAALEEAARTVAEAGGAEVSVTLGKDLEDEFPLIHTVGRAADVPPRLVSFEWGQKDAPRIALVGKGVCFDSGGLNIKGSKGMALMKKDMGGAANVLGLAAMIMAANLPVRLHVLLPIVENAISGNAFRPGDVFRSRNGMTVEIGNTDAEGRLILADALALAAEDNPAHIISLATLTGAARVALGPDLTPIYSTDDGFAALATAAGTRIADPLWHMPFWNRYDDYLTSDIADVSHIGGNGFAGSIVAAQFLKRFVPSTIPYTHCDLFAWVPSSRPGRPKGGEAMAVRALFAALREQVDKL